MPMYSYTIYNEIIFRSRLHEFADSNSCCDLVCLYQPEFQMGGLHYRIIILRQVAVICISDVDGQCWSTCPCHAYSFKPYTRLQNTTVTTAYDSPRRTHVDILTLQDRVVIFGDSESMATYLTAFTVTQHKGICASLDVQANRFSIKNVGNINWFLLSAQFSVTSMNHSKGDPLAWLRVRWQKLLEQGVTSIHTCGQHTTNIRL